MQVKHEIQIDCDALVAELIDQWTNGQKNDVIHQLATDHAGLTAMVLCIGCTDGPLTRGDMNEITNRLNDMRTDIARNAM